MFGLADTMGSYNEITSTTESIMELANDSIAMEKESYYVDEYDDDYIRTISKFSDDEDITALKDKYGIRF